MGERMRQSIHTFRSTLVVTALVVIVFIVMAYNSIGARVYRDYTSSGSIFTKRFMENDGYMHTNESKVRILCVILTMEKDIATKVKAVNETWATRCDRHLYVITSAIKRPDFLNIDIPDSRTTLVHKLRKAYEIIYEKYINDFDWIYKCDDDTFAIVDNLRFLLSHYRSDLPGYLGYHFNKFVKNGYMSGGAGYVFSNKALRLLVERGYRTGACAVVPNPDDPENSEDIETGKCLQTVGVPVLSSLDIEGRETFHPYPPAQHLLGPLPEYLYTWAMNPVQTGENCCSPYAISFHYMSVESMYLVNHLLYNTRVHGIHSDPGTDGPVYRLGEVRQVPSR